MPTAPDWIASRLVPRLATGDIRVHRVGLDDPGYIALMREYTAQTLGRSPADGEFHQLLEKAEGLFLYLSFLVEQMAFLVEQMALGRLASDALRDQPSGEGLFLRFLAEFKRDLGGKRLAEEAELLLLALAAEELAHDWAFGEGLTYDHAGAPVLVDDPEWRGVALDDLAAVLDRARPDGQPEGLLLYAVFRLKAAIGVDRGGAAEAQFRLWLKGLARAMAADPAWSQRLRALHARAAGRMVDAAEQALAAPDDAQAGSLAAWSRMLPRGLGHAVLSGSDPVLHRIRDGDTVLGAALRQSVAAQEHADWVSPGGAGRECCHYTAAAPRCRANSGGLDSGRVEQPRRCLHEPRQCASERR